MSSEKINANKTIQIIQFETQANDIQKAACLIDEVLCWVDSGSLEAEKLLKARNILESIVW